MINNSNFERGLKDAEKSVGGLSAVFSKLAGVLSVAAFVGWAKRVVGWADDMRDFAGTLNVSTQFLQGWREAVANSGGTAEAADKALQQLTLKMGDLGLAGRTVEQALGDVADAMAAAGDPTTRAEIAMDAFGKAGLRVQAAMQGGAKSVQQLVAEASKLSETEIAELANVGAVNERFAARFRTTSARWLAATVGAVRGYGGALVGMFQGKGFMTALHAEAQIQKAEAQTTAAGIRAENEAAAAAAKRKAEEEEIRRLNEENDRALERAKRAQTEQEKTLADLTEKRAQHEERIADAAERTAAAGANLATFRADRGSMTLGEIATMQARNRFGAQQSAAAREVLAAEEYGALAKAHGREDIRDRAFAYADRLRSQIVGLSESDRNPTTELIRRLAATEKSLANLEQMAADGTFTVQAKGAP